MAQFQFKNQENPSLRQRVVSDIRNAIFHGDLKSGDKLKELEISEQMKISRGPIREAFRDLEAMGLVVCAPYRETVVADVEKSEIVDLLIPIRLQLELYSIKSNLDNYDEPFFTVLNTIISSMEVHAAAGDLFGLIEEDIRFHEHILSFNQSSYAMQIWANIVNRLRLHFIKNTQEFTDLNRVPLDHIQLLKVLQGKDLTNIAKIWTEHIHNEDCLLCFS